MNDFELLFSGQITAGDFMAFLFADDALWAQLEALIPQEAKENPEHDIWKTISRTSLEPYHYRVRDMLYSWYGFAEKEFDQRQVYDFLCRLYCWHYPETKCKKPRPTEFDFRMDVVGDTYGGREVERLIDRIMEQTKAIPKKADRKKEAKRLLAECFHTEDGKKPRWVQGPEWPMGAHSPMKYVERKRQGEKVEHVFRDVDTGEERIVEEFY